MPVKISLKRAVQSAIIFIMFVAVLMVWPFKLIGSWEKEGELPKDSFQTLYYEETVWEELVPQQFGLTYLELFLGNEKPAAEDKLKLEVYNENMELLESREILLKKFSNSGICKIKLSSKPEEGSPYYISIQNLGKPLLLATKDGTHPVLVSVYKVHYSKIQYLVRALLLLAVGGLLLLVTEQILRKSARKVRFDYGIRLAAAVLLTGFLLWLAYCVFPGRRFSTDIVEILFYEAGIFLLLAYMLYGLLHRREDMLQEKLCLKDVKERLPGFLQVLAFAGVMEMCVCKVNAPTSYQQIVSADFMYFFFAIAILCSFTKKELWNWYNLVYGIVAFAAGALVWMRKTVNWDPIEQMHLRQELFTDIGKWFIWGFILLNTFLLLWKGRRKTEIQKEFLAAVLLLLVGMTLFRNGRTWIFEIAVFWGMFMLQVLYRGNRSLWIKRFSEGILLQFLYKTVYCMLHRPYQTEVGVGYPMAFHTTTVTGVYLALIIALALTGFVRKYKTDGKPGIPWKEAGITGIAFAFLLMSLNRTGLLAVILILPILLLAATIAEHRDGIKGFLRRLLILLGIMIAFFVVVFTIIRTVPAIVSKPIAYDVEQLLYKPSVEPGEEWDSPNFITVKLFFEKVRQRLFLDADAGVNVNADKLSSGRLVIWKAYLRELNWTGHEKISVELENGRTAAHAHNTYIQNAHDFGIGVGVYFIVVYIFSGAAAILYFLKSEDKEMRLIPLALIGTFGISSLTEWTFQPTFPMGFAFLTMIALLLIKEEKRQH